MIKRPGEHVEVLNANYSSLGYADKAATGEKIKKTFGFILLTLLMSRKIFVVHYFWKSERILDPFISKLWGTDHACSYHRMAKKERADIVVISTLEMPVIIKMIRRWSIVINSR